MSDDFGIIFDKNEIKMLILFVMKRMSEPVTMDVLTELTMCDENISYFDVTECILKLTKTKHLSLSGDKYSLTDKGRRNGEILEKDLPYSVREKAQKAAEHVSAAYKRDSLIKTFRKINDNNECKVILSLSDGISDILSIELYTANAEQAEKLEKGFRKNAEKMYNSVVELITM